MKICDLTAGYGSMWFDSFPDPVTFCDLNPKHSKVIKADWSVRLPFDDCTFDLVVFDPPHLFKSYASSGKLAEQYGYLFPSWQSDLSNAFKEAFRITKPQGIIIFKWNTRCVSIHEVLKLTDKKPLFGHTTSWTNKSTTIWCLFVVPDPVNSSSNPQG